MVPATAASQARAHLGLRVRGGSCRSRLRWPRSPLHVGWKGRGEGQHPRRGNGVDLELASWELACLSTDPAKRAIPSLIPPAPHNPLHACPSVPVPSPHSQAPLRPRAPLPGDLAARPLPSTSPRGGAATSSHERTGMPGWAVRQRLGWECRGGGPFPWPFPGNVFLACGGSLTLETPNSLAQGSRVQPPRGPRAGSPARCLQGAGTQSSPASGATRGRTGGQVPWGPCWSHCSHPPERHCPASAGPTHRGTQPNRVWSQRSSSHGLSGAMSPGGCRGNSQSAATRRTTFPSSPGVQGHSCAPVSQARIQPEVAPKGLFFFPWPICCLPCPSGWDCPLRARWHLAAGRSPVPAMDLPPHFSGASTPTPGWDMLRRSLLAKNRRGTAGYRWDKETKPVSPSAPST